jgi:hypothetical protein
LSDLQSLVNKFPELGAPFLRTAHGFPRRLKASGQSRYYAIKFRWLADVANQLWGGFKFSERRFSLCIALRNKN